MKRYFYHPESDMVWSEDLPEDQFPHTDGLVEELSRIEYEQMLVKQESECELPDALIDLILDIDTSKIDSDE
jgi:hypothetical protein